MLTFDYQGWVERVRSFSEGLRTLPGEIDVSVQIEPPLSGNALKEISKKWGRELPDVLRRFWSEGASAIHCRYVWEPPEYLVPKLQEIFEYNSYIYGGVRFLPAANVFPGNSGTESDDDCMAETVGQNGLDLWCRCAIFLHVGNGDCLGLDPTSNQDDPAVIYLCHDDDWSGRISPSFTDFLVAWEKLSYIGPEHWLLSYWLDWDKGAIDATRHKTQELRRLLTNTPEKPRTP